MSQDSTVEATEPTAPEAETTQEKVSEPTEMPQEAQPEPQEQVQANANEEPDNTPQEPKVDPVSQKAKEDLKGAIERKNHFRDKSEKLAAQLKEEREKAAREREIIKSISHLAPQGEGREAWIDDVTSNVLSSEQVTSEETEDGSFKVSGVSDAVESVKVNKPYLFMQQKPQAKNTGATTVPTQESERKASMTLKDVANMDPSEFMANARNIAMGINSGDIK